MSLSLSPSSCVFLCSTLCCCRVPSLRVEWLVCTKVVHGFAEGIAVRKIAGGMADDQAHALDRRLHSRRLRVRVTPDTRAWRQMQGFTV